MSPRSLFPAGRHLRWLCLGLALAGLTTAQARRNDAIVISASAKHDYVRPLDAEGWPLPETYVFMEGAHLGSTTADASEGKMTFDTITRTLAANLIKQNYVPTRDIAGAKLLIRVYWGSTQVYEDPQKLQDMDRLNAAVSTFRSSAEQNGGIADPGDLNALMQDAAGDQFNTDGMIARNAALLGYKRSLDKLGNRIIATSDEEDLRGELSEERYFVVLLAYDYEFLCQKKKPRLLWVTRLSIRSPGNNFTEALPMLALAGAESYGRNQDDLQRVKVRALPGGDVRMPEVEVLGTVSVGGK